MGFLDRLKSLVGPRTAVSVDLTGPLRLGLGDGVGYYKERFAVTGVRRVEGGGQVVWQYCLRDRSGERTVLVAEEGPEARLWIQRIVEAELPWDQDVLDGIDEEPFKLTARGRADVVAAGDTGVPAAGAVEYREFEDSSSERTVVLEDWAGQREVRVGELVHEAELSFVRSSESGGDPVDAWGDTTGEIGTLRGTPDAAKGALTEHRDDDPDTFSGEEAPEDRDPTAFDDDDWDEDDEDHDISTANGVEIEAVIDSEEDEWHAAAAVLRAQSAAAERR